jgi:hypothetical protein
MPLAGTFLFTSVALRLLTPSLVAGPPVGIPTRTGVPVLLQRVSKGIPQG